MLIKFNKVRNGKGISFSLYTKLFNIGFGFGKATKEKPVFYYKCIVYDKINKLNTTLRHVNIIRFKNFTFGVTIHIPL